MTTELQPQYDTRQSFYGKAKIIEALITGNGDVIEKQLISYDAHVASIIFAQNEPNSNKWKDKAIVYATYSQTTLRHIKEFLKQNGFKADSKAQIERDYMEAA